MIHKTTKKIKLSYDVDAFWSFNYERPKNQFNFNFVITYSIAVPVAAINLDVDLRFAYWLDSAGIKVIHSIVRILLRDPVHVPIIVLVNNLVLS